MAPKRARNGNDSEAGSSKQMRKGEKPQIPEGMTMTKIDKAVIKRIMDAIVADTLTPEQTHALFCRYCGEWETMTRDTDAQLSELGRAMEMAMDKLVPAIDTIWAEGTKDGKDMFFGVANEFQDPMIELFLDSCPPWITQRNWGTQVIASLVQDPDLDSAAIYVRRGYAMDRETTLQVLRSFATTPKKFKYSKLIEAIKSTNPAMALDFVEALLVPDMSSMSGFPAQGISEALDFIDPNHTEIGVDVLYRAARTCPYLVVLEALMDHVKESVDHGKLYDIVCNTDSANMFSAIELMDQRGLLAKQQHPSLRVKGSWIPVGEAFFRNWKCAPTDDAALVKHAASVMVYCGFCSKNFKLEHFLEKWDPIHTMSPKGNGRKFAEAHKDTVLAVVESYIPEDQREKLGPLFEKLKERFDVK